MLDVLAPESQFDDEAAFLAIVDFFGRLIDADAVADLTQTLAVPKGCSEAAQAACRTLNAFLERTRTTLYEMCRVS
ncbi:MAG: hypothetical protein JWN27_1303, partial [Candidatus Eremiobacteraeota bacterium]|nr:hypothetical protein [Candidatus Eremiobacteraeota bacterium]